MRFIPHRRRVTSLLPIDAIQEFNTEQNPKAEYGWEPGSVINVGVKSGTNSLHGAAYAFGRDAQATDAANYFSTPAFPGATPATLEQFGATAGGRIIKDKLFWFAGYEGLRTTLGDVAVLPRSRLGYFDWRCENEHGRPHVTSYPTRLANGVAGNPISPAKCAISGTEHGDMHRLALLVDI